MNIREGVVAGRDVNAVVSQYATYGAAHLFMPRLLPTVWSGTDEKLEAKLAFWCLFERFMDDQGARLLASAGMDGLGTALTAVVRTTMAIGEDSDKILEAMKRKEDVWMYLRAQTCLVRMRSSDETHVTISAFDIHLPKDENITNEQYERLTVPSTKKGSVFSVGARVGMPRVTVRAETVQVHSVSFARRLSEMVNTPAETAKITKNGVEMEESRQLPLSTGVFNWLLPAVAIDEAESVQPAVQMWKKLRTDVMYSEGPPWYRSPQYNALRAVIQTIVNENVAGNDAHLVYKTLMLEFLSWAALKVSPKVVRIDMCAKLAQRISKIQSLTTEATRLTEWKQRVLALATSATVELKKGLQLAWDKEREDFSASQQIRLPPVTKLDLSPKHELKKTASKPILELLDRVVKPNESFSSVEPTPSAPSTCLATDAVDMENIEAFFTSARQELDSRRHTKTDIRSTLDLQWTLCRVEHIIQGVIWPILSLDPQINVKVGAIRAAEPLLKAYIDLTKTVYDNDPRLKSVRMLTILTMTVIIDWLELRYDSLCRWSEAIGAILYKCRLPFDPSEVAESLLLQSKDEHVCLQSVLVYWNKRREPNIPIFDIKTPFHSLAFEYYSKDKDMQSHVATVRLDDEVLFHQRQVSVPIFF